MSANEQMLYFLFAPIVIGIVAAFFIGKPEKWKLFFTLGAILLVISRLTLIFQHKSDPSAALEALMKLSGPLMAIGGLFIGFGNVLVFKHFKTINKSENNS